MPFGTPYLIFAVDVLYKWELPIHFFHRGSLVFHDAVLVMFYALLSVTNHSVTFKQFSFVASQVCYLIYFTRWNASVQYLFLLSRSSEWTQSFQRGGQSGIRLQATNCCNTNDFLKVALLGYMCVFFRVQRRLHL